MPDAETRPLRKLAGPAIIVLAAVVAIAPLMARGIACGSDFGFHFVSWLDAERSMTLGVFYPHWANSPNLGAGEPQFVFYPPLSWMAGAILGLLLPWKAVPIVFFALLLAATGLANRALAREVLPDGAATLAGCASIFFGYTLFSVYKRCDFAELAGGIWIPLMLLFALRRRIPTGSLMARAFDGSAAPLALVMAGTWLTNGPVGIMASYLLAGVVAVSAILERSFAPIVRGAAGAALGMGLAADYLLPAVLERKWVSIQYATTLSHFVIENSWLFARHADPGMYSHDMLLHRVSWVAVIMLAIAAAGGAIAWMRGALPGERRWWLPLALIPPAVLFLLLPVSHFVWNLLPELRLLQFPWRWLLILETPMAIFFAAAVWSARRRIKIAVVAASALAFAACSVAAERMWWVDCSVPESSMLNAVENGTGTIARPEYAPAGVKYAILDRIVHSACLLDSGAAAADGNATASAPVWNGQSDTCKGDFKAAMFLPEHKAVVGVAGHAGYLILRLRYYPAWRVLVNNAPVTAVAEQERGLLAVPVPEGEVHVKVDWSTTGDVIAGRWVSGITLLLLAALWFVERMRARTQLS